MHEMPDQDDGPFIKKPFLANPLDMHSLFFEDATESFKVPFRNSSTICTFKVSSSRSGSRW